MIQLSSFRDPAGSLFTLEARVFRRVSPAALAVLRQVLDSPKSRHLVESGKIVLTTELSPQSASQLLDSSNQKLLDKSDHHVVEHERIWFPSYPYEWPPEMLFAAGDLTIELAELLFEDGFGLKDATPYNVLFCGPKPIFVDVLSFEKRMTGDPRWLAHGQFVRMFILPLLMNRKFATTGAEIFLAHRDGLEPEQVYPHANWSQRLRSPFLTTVSMPVWLARRMNPDEKKLYQDSKPTVAEKADFILQSQLRRARKLLRGVKPGEGRTSTWSSYTDNLSYASEEFETKTGLVRKWLRSTRPSSALDVGCNTGHFSQIAAEAGARVVAIDLDPVVVGMTWRRASAGNLNILPLVVNLARPTPSTGWRNAEYPSFLERASGSFDTVMMLAVLHHLLVTERIPLLEIVELCQRLTTNYLIIEYVSNADEMFQRLTRGRESLHADFTQDSLEAAFGQSFTIIEKSPVKGKLRWLYLLQRVHG